MRGPVHHFRLCTFKTQFWRGCRRFAATLVLLATVVALPSATADGAALRAWIEQCRGGTASPERVVVDGAIAALSKVGLDVLDILIVEFGEPEDVRAVDWMERLCGILGPVDACSRLEALSRRWPDARRDLIAELYARTLRAADGASVASPASPFPGVGPMLASFTGEETYYNRDPRVARIINQGPSRRVMRELLSNLRGIDRAKESARAYATADALAALMLPDEEYEKDLADLLQSGNTLAARAFWRLPTTPENKATLLRAVALGYLDRDVLESLERYGAEVDVGSAVQEWVRASSLSGLNAVVAAGEFLVRHKHTSAVGALQSYRDGIKSRAVTWRVSLALVLLGDKASFEVLMSLLRLPPPDALRFYSEMRSLLNPLAGEDLVGRVPYHLSGYEEERSAMAAGVENWWTRAGASVRWDSHALAWRAAR